MKEKYQNHYNFHLITSNMYESIYTNPRKFTYLISLKMLDLGDIAAFHFLCFSVKYILAF